MCPDVCVPGPLSTGQADLQGSREVSPLTLNLTFSQPQALVTLVGGGEGTIPSYFYLRVPFARTGIPKDPVPSRLGGGWGRGEWRWPLGQALTLFLHPVPQPIAEEDCVRHICLEGQLIRVNRSQHCPEGAEPLHCGVLGLGVRVGGDHCCPLWECACESWNPLEPPMSSLYPCPSVTSAPDWVLPSLRVTLP